MKIALRSLFASLLISHAALADDIEYPFDDLIPTLERDLGEIDDGKPVELLCPSPHHVVLEEIGDDLDLDE